MGDSVKKISQHWMGVSLGAAVWLCAASSQAHISLERESSHESRYGDGAIKAAPCGQAGGARGSNVYTYKPGATINITINEYVSHAGYFRIAFDDDGDDDFVTPSGTNGENGNCAGDPKCAPGLEDYCNNDTVLWDNLDPHAGAFPATPSYTWSVQLSHSMSGRVTSNSYFAPVRIEAVGRSHSSSSSSTVSLL